MLDVPTDLPIYKPSARLYLGYVTSETLAQRVRRLREALGLSQDGLSKRANVSATHVWQVENNRRKRLQEATAQLYADALKPAMPEAAQRNAVEYLLFGWEQTPVGDLPPLDTYLRRSSDLDEEQIGHMRRTMQALEAERRLEASERRVAELEAQYEARAPSPGIVELEPIPGEPIAAHPEEPPVIEEWPPKEGEGDDPEG